MILEEMPTTTQLGKHIYSLAKVVEAPPVVQAGEQTIQFTRSELASTPLASMQPLVVSALIDNWQVHRVLVDTGACRDVLYYSCFIGLGLTDAHLKPYSGTLEGFTNHRVGVKGTIEVLIGDSEHTRKEVITFLVIDLNSPYNAILGIPSMAKFQMVASVPHQRAKFYAANGVGVINTRPRVMWEYVRDTQKKKQKLTISTREHPSQPPKRRSLIPQLA